MDAVSISPDGTRIVTGSRDCTVCVCSAPSNTTTSWLQTLQALHRHSYAVPWLYNSRDGHLLADKPIRVGSLYSHSLTWTGLGRALLVSSKDGHMHCINMATGTTFSKWAIH